MAHADNDFNDAASGVKVEMPFVKGTAHAMKENLNVNDKN